MRRVLAALVLLAAAPAPAPAPAQAPAPAVRPVPLPPPPGGLPVKPPAAAPAAAPAGPSEDEKACAPEAEAVARRERLFRGQGLAPEEVERRSAAARALLDACLARQREERAIRAEIAARTPPGAAAAERARVEREVRLTHARAHPDEERTEAERRLLAQERERLERERAAPPATPEAAAAPAPTPAPERDPAEARRDLAQERGLAEHEALACRSELGVLEQRRRVNTGRHLSAEEVRRRNAPHEQALADCLTRHRREERLAEEERRVLAEIAARTPPLATERDRDRIAREVRLQHARAKGREERTAAERALVAEAEVAEARQREAEARLKDPVLRRRALSGQQCAHQARRDRARQELAEEERIAALGGGDRQRAYFLRSELKRDEEVLHQNGLELQAAGGALPCGERFVGRVARCVDARIDGRSLQDCESEEMQLALSALVR